MGNVHLVLLSHCKYTNMALISFWESNPAATMQLTIEQIVATAGDGKLLDNSLCSDELRQFLAQVGSDKLAEFAEHCLTNAFPKSGLVLQDVINELGRRLDYQVQNGRYQGVVGGIGYDGIWSSPEGNEIVVEVKTTDAYRISLDTIATYRYRLHSANRLTKASSVLLVVGREDTGELEAQVRGSRHAWEMRLISIDALLTLVKLKESTEAGVTGAKIRSILIPMEYTRLDTLIDVMFTAAKDVEVTVESEKPANPDDDGDESETVSGPQTGDTKSLQVKRDEILSALNQRDGKKLIKRSRALYWDASHTYKAACTISKRYTRKGSPTYWYAYHPNWDKFLEDGTTSYLVLGGMDLSVAFILPLAIIRSHLDKLSVTLKDGGDMYWHLKIFELAPNKFALQLPKADSYLQLADYQLIIEPVSHYKDEQPR